MDGPQGPHDITTTIPTTHLKDPLGDYAQSRQSLESTKGHEATNGGRNRHCGAKGHGVLRFGPENRYPYGKTQGVSVRTSGSSDDPNNKPEDSKRDSNNSMRTSSDQSKDGKERGNISRVSEDLNAVSLKA
jgi:hypothetical protein